MVEAEMFILKMKGLTGSSVRHQPSYMMAETYMSIDKVRKAMKKRKMKKGPGVRRRQ